LADWCTLSVKLGERRIEEFGAQAGGGVQLFLAPCDGSRTGDEGRDKDQLGDDFMTSSWFKLAVDAFPDRRREARPPHAVGIRFVSARPWKRDERQRAQRRPTQLPKQYGPFGAPAPSCSP
jgi:hypothetical protein